MCTSEDVQTGDEERVAELFNSIYFVLDTGAKKKKKQKSRGAYTVGGMIWSYDPSIPFHQCSSDQHTIQSKMASYCEQ